MNQKGFAILTSAIFAIILLAGCTKQLASSSSDESISNATSASIGQETQINGNDRLWEASVFEQPLSFHDGSLGSANEKGYYEIAVRTDGISSILYTDFTSQQRVVLCNRPECTHGDNTCVAYVADSICQPVPIAQNNRLILLYQGWPGLEGKEGIAGRIEVRDLNGTNVKCIASFSAQTQILLACATDSENLYVLANTVSLERMGAFAKKELLQINLFDGTIRTLMTFPPKLTQNLMIIGAFDNTLLFKRIGTSEEFENFFEKESGGVDDWNAMIQSQQHEIFCFNDAGEEVILASWGQTQAKGFVLKDKCYVCYADGTLREIDLQTKQNQLITTFTQNFLLPTVELFDQDGKTLVIDIGPEGYQPGLVPLERYKIEIETGTMERLTQVVSFDGVVAPVSIIAKAKGYMIIQSGIEENKRDVSYDVQGDRLYQYSLVSYSDFLNNKTGFKLSTP